MMRLLITLSLGTLAFAACGDELRATADAIDAIDTDAIGDTRLDGSDVVPSETLEVAADAEIIYPGHPCGGDKQCSTGLCYGIATPQGAFESPKCQTLCLGLEDFARYCDSDDDCCAGTCCIGCGAREGLCVPKAN